MKTFFASIVLCALALGPAVAQGNYDFLKRDNPFGAAEQRGQLPRLSQSVAVPSLGVTVFQSRAADGHPLVLIDQIDGSGPLARLAGQILPGGVAVNAIETYHPGGVAELMQIMSAYRPGTTVKLQLLQFLPKIGFLETPVRLL
jgi:hypothetical protein